MSQCKGRGSYSNLLKLNNIQRIIQSQPPQVSAMSWIISSAEDSEAIASKSNYERLEIASLTKIMTAYVSMKIIQKLDSDVSQTYIKVPRAATFVCGTTAQLKFDDILSFQDVIYALMLPSGNDAALTLANWGGQTIDYLNNIKRENQREKLSAGSTRVQRKITPLNKPIIIYDKDQIQFHDTDYVLQSTKEDSDKTRNSSTNISQNMNDINSTFDDNISRFVKEMNQIALKLGMRETQFTNVHGLASKANKSTVDDMAKLCTQFLKDEFMRQVVRTKQYQVKSQKTIYKWINTNILLNQKNFYGLKTGFTPNAGACLAVLYDLLQLVGEKENSKDNSLNGFIVVVLLGARDQNKRFSEVQRLIQWIESQFPQQIIPRYKLTQSPDITKLHPLCFRPPRSAFIKKDQGNYIQNERSSVRRQATQSATRTQFIIKPNKIDIQFQ